MRRFKQKIGEKTHAKYFRFTSLLTGYKANADGTNWCYFDGEECLDTETDTSIGMMIHADLGWNIASGKPDCNLGFIADAINGAIRNRFYFLISNKIFQK